MLLFVLFAIPSLIAVMLYLIWCFGRFRGHEIHKENVRSAVRLGVLSLFFSNYLSWMAFSSHRIKAVDLIISAPSHCMKYFCVESAVAAVVLALFLAGEKWERNIKIHEEPKYRKREAVKKSGTIEFYRLIFAVTVLLFHSGAFVKKGEAIFVNGWIGVEFFFIVTGFLMAQTARNTLEYGSVGEASEKYILKKIGGFWLPFFISEIIGFSVRWMTEGWKIFSGCCHSAESVAGIAAA